MDGKIINGLKLISLKSEIIPIFPDNPEQNEIQPEHLKSVVSEYFTSSGSVYVVAYLYSAVIIGKFEGNDFVFYQPEESDEKLKDAYLLKQFNEHDIVKLRIFNQEQELLVWKSKESLKARIRKDALNGSGCEAVVADHVIAGTQTEPLENGWIRLSEQRVSFLDLPLKNAHVDVKNKPDKRIFIRTNNYISENETHQSTYCDCRFVGFTEGPETKLIQYVIRMQE